MGKSAIRYLPIAFGSLMLVLAGCSPSASKSSGAKSQATAPAVAAAAPAPQEPAPVQPSPLTMEQQRVKVLIEQVEAAYNKGVADYQKGNLPEAKIEFDRAVDLMLAGGVDIHSTPELQEEFDRIVDGVNALETEALKQGNGFVAQEEPTPADVASDITLPADPNIVAKAKAELATTKSDLPLVVNDSVGIYINFFANTTKGHNTLLHSFQRAGRYKQMIQRVLAEEGVPQDLIYLAVAESGFQPRAVNRRSRAGGMWQFMPGPYYGLTRNAYVDERFDPEKSTRAYGRYMKFIYDELGDWYLAMAAYDHGTGNIQREVQKTGYADFWELYRRNVLPRETANYVPEILAAIIIANNPHQYGFDDLALDPPVLTDTVTINYSLDLRLASDLVGVPVDELMALNPSLLRMITPPDGTFDLHLPPGAAATFNDRIAVIPQSHRNSWRYHRVAPGDTLASIAREYHLSAAEVALANQMHQDDSLGTMEAVAIPVAPAPAISANTMLYTVRRGDTLVTIADRFGVSLAQLRRWNRMAGTRVEPGRRLRVAEPAVVYHGRRRRGSASAAAKNPATHSATANSAPANTTARPAQRSKTDAGGGKSAALRKKTSRAHTAAARAGHSALKQK
jgi:membrane-bound lytic murein transglycosylase D